MDGEQFIGEAKRHLAAYLYRNKHNDKRFMGLTENKIFVSWLSKIGMDNKGLFGIDGSNDYFEICYYGREKKFVLDHYTLKKHLCIKESDDEQI